MNWIGMIVGFAVAVLAGEMFGRTGGLIALGALGGLFIGRLQKQLDALRGELALLRKQQAAVHAAAAYAAPETLPRDARPNAAPPAAAAAPAAASVPLATAPPAPAREPAREPAAAPAIERPAPRTAPPPSPRPAAVIEPDERSLPVTSSLGASLIAWFRGGNTIVRVAVLILFIGVAFLLRYAAEHTTVPIEWRLALVALGGTALTALGLKLVRQRRGYGLSLQGAGLGIVYLTLFAALRIWHLLPAGLAFALLAALAALTAVLAVRQDALPLAALGFGGAFLAPVLTSTGTGSHVALFSYELLLNLAIAWIAQRKAWKLLNLEGFLFTFAISGAWGLKAYTPEHFGSTEPFLVAHFALYLFIAVQYTRRMVEHSAPGTALPLVDGSLLFGTPIVAFGLQAALLKDDPLMLAFSAAALAGIYLLVGQWLWRRAGQQLVLLVEGLVALGLIFLALVTPLALDARWTSAAWAVQGCGVLWIALRQRRWWAAGMGLLLQLGAAISYWGHDDPMLRGATFEGLRFANSLFLGALLLALAALTSARLLERARSGEGRAEWLATPVPGALMLGLGVAQLWIAGIIELEHWDQQRLDPPTLVAGWCALLMAAFELARARLAWPQLRWPVGLMMFGALLASAAGLVGAGNAAAAWARYTSGFGLLEAIALIALGIWRLRRRGADASALGHLSLAWYAMLQGGVLLYTLGAVFVARHEGWTPAAAIVPPTLLALWLMGRLPEWLRPLYRAGLQTPWLAALLLWVLAVNALCDASMAPLPYLPLLNPLDLAHGLVLVYALKLAPALPQWRRPLAIAGAALAFWWLNSLLIRTLHHWAGTPMWEHGALDSALVQTALSVLWTTTALVAMLVATRRAPASLARPLWMAGAALLGAVVVKLFLVDLSSLGSLARIVSFLAVGVLMLVIGYVSPLPPAQGEESKA